MRKVWRENSLAIVFGLLFLGALVGQAFAGWHAFDADQIDHHQHSISLGRYLVSSSFGNAVLENWQSEYLQFTLYVLLTVWLIQKGSAESKQPGDAGTESDSEQRVGEHAQRNSPLWAKVGGLRTAVYSNSLLIVMTLIWLASWFVQSVTGWSEFSSDQLLHGGHRLSYAQYLGTGDFWEATLQNWQSEFLAVGSFAVLSIWLRQRGSPESKPVGAPHTGTGGSD